MVYKRFNPKSEYAVLMLVRLGDENTSNETKEEM